MNSAALCAGFLVLHPEQERSANAQGCWNWFDTDAGVADGDASLIMSAIDQVCLVHPVHRARVAIAGLSAGATMAAQVVTRDAGCFEALVMHSGIPPGTAHSTVSALGGDASSSYGDPQELDAARMVRALAARQFRG